MLPELCWLLYTCINWREKDKTDIAWKHSEHCNTINNKIPFALCEGHSGGQVSDSGLVDLSDGRKVYESTQNFHNSNPTKLGSYCAISWSASVCIMWSLKGGKINHYMDKTNKNRYQGQLLEAGLAGGIVYESPQGFPTKSGSYWLFLMSLYHVIPQCCSG